MLVNSRDELPMCQCASAVVRGAGVWPVRGVTRRPVVAVVGQSMTHAPPRL